MIKYILKNIESNVKKEILLSVANKNQKFNLNYAINKKEFLL